MSSSFLFSLLWVNFTKIIFDEFQVLLPISANLFLNLTFPSITSSVKPVARVVSEIIRSLIANSMKTL